MNKRENEEKQVRLNERYARAEHDCPYVVRDGMKITMDNLSRAVSDSEKTLPSFSLAVDFVRLFRESTRQSSMEIVHEIPEEDEANVLDSKVQLVIVKSGSMFGEHMPSL